MVGDGHHCGECGSGRSCRSWRGWEDQGGASVQLLNECDRLSWLCFLWSYGVGAAVGRFVADLSEVVRYDGALCGPFCGGRGGKLDVNWLDLYFFCLVCSVVTCGLCCLGSGVLLSGFNRVILEFFGAVHGCVL